MISIPWLIHQYNWNNRLFPSLKAGWPLNAISNYCHLYCCGSLMLTIQEGRKMVWSTPFLSLWSSVFICSCIQKTTCSPFLFPILLMRKLRLAAPVIFAALISLCEGSGLSTCLDYDIKSLKICMGNQDSAVLEGWKQLAHWVGQFFLDHFWQINVLFANQYSAHSHPGEGQRRSVIWTKSK